MMKNEIHPTTYPAFSLRWRPLSARTPTTFFSTAMLLASGFVLGACHEPKPLPEAAHLPTVPVKVERLALTKHRLEEEIVGTVHAKLRATLEAKVAGRIKVMPVRLGDHVKEGDLIARLEVEEIQARVRQAEAVLSQAETDRQRYRALVEKGAATPQELEGMETRYVVAKASVSEARTMLGYAQVKAPFAGVVMHKMADVGDLATPGRPLVDLEDPASLRLEVAVPEALIGFLKVGTPIPATIGTNTRLDAVVAEIAPAANPGTRTFLVKLDLPSSDLPSAESLRPGQFGRAMIPTRRSEILRIPEASVIHRGQMEIVFVAVDGHAQLRLIKTGKLFGDSVEVVAGLEPDDLLVVEGASGLVDGQPVEVAQ
ncbi:MAG: efflux RND transporter periplasmic adaptor subunit [Deltaproteobacteria bacterium]|nr:efflux RND transporter periplasmic adaptor subunit [Deltaproteobacteria bacterium]